MDDDKSGIVFLFRLFLFVSYYPHGKVPGSDLDVVSENDVFLDKLKLNLSIIGFIVHCQTQMFVLFTILYCKLSQWGNVCLFVC